MGLKDRKVYSIIHKESGEIWVARSGKTAWAKPNHAKAAWKLGKGCNEVEHDSLSVLREERWDTFKDRVSFNDQSVYEVKEMACFTDKAKLDKAIELLNQAVVYADSPLQAEIVEFLGKDLEEP